MKYFLKNIFSILPGKLVKELKKQLKLPLVNIYKTGFSKNVLISYIRQPFISGMDLSHTNRIEAVEIAKIFSRLNYNVDVVNYDYEGFIDYKKYEIIFGFGEPLNNCFTEKRNETKVIYYGTGMHIYTQNYNSLNRIENVQKIKGKWLVNSGRIVDKTWSVQNMLADAVITLGNDLVKESYKKYFNKNIYLLPASFIKKYDFKSLVESKNFGEAKKNYLWFGSGGKIHKGLDLLLDYFVSCPELHLHICGSLEGEEEFKNTYRKELFETPNIHFHGFVLIDSKKFEQLLKDCAFVIFPSCSEAGGPSVLNVCGNGGLIPIVSKETTINIGKFGIEIKSLDRIGIDNAVSYSRSLDTNTLKEKSLNCGRFVNENHSIKNFTDAFAKNLENILTPAKK